MIVLSYGRYRGYNASYAETRVNKREYACACTDMCINHILFHVLYVCVYSYMCIHEDVQTSTASESFRCDVCRQRRAFFSEKATTRVYVTRQKLLDFSCFGVVRLGKYRGEKSRMLGGSSPTRVLS